MKGSFAPAAPSTGSTSCRTTSRTRPDIHRRRRIHSKQFSLAARERNVKHEQQFFSLQMPAKFSSAQRFVARNLKFSAVKQRKTITIVNTSLAGRGRTRTCVLGSCKPAPVPQRGGKMLGGVGGWPCGVRPTIGTAADFQICFRCLPARSKSINRKLMVVVN